MVITIYIRQEVAAQWETNLVFMNIVKVRKAMYEFARLWLLNIASYTHYEIVFLNGLILKTTFALNGRTEYQLDCVSTSIFLQL